MEKFTKKFAKYTGYFEDIRVRIRSIAFFFVAFFVLGFLGTGRILHAFVGAFNLENVQIVTTSPFQFLELATKIGFYTACLLCIPLIVYHLYDFLKDGLNRKEKRLFFIFLPIGLVLFAVGFAYSFTILYFYLSSVSSINLAFGLKNVWDISSFLSQILMASVFLGIIFQFPLVLTFLIRIGLVNVDYLRKKRYYAFAAIFIFVGMLPPPDIFSTILQAAPLILMYEVTVRANSLRSFQLQNRSSSIIVN